MFRVSHNVLRNCEVFKDRNPYLKSIVVFSNPKAKPKIMNETDYGCIVSSNQKRGRPESR
jgi:hypothetical protein